MKKRTYFAWKSDEIKLLTENINLNPDDLVKLFPTRTYNSVLSMKHRILTAEPPVETNQAKIEFDVENLDDNENQIEYVRGILNQALVKLEEFGTKNQELHVVIGNLENIVSELQYVISRKENTIKELEKALLDVNSQYESDKSKFESLASETKSTWGRIKKVFL